MLAGDEPDDHNATWTQRQVDERRGRDLATLVAEWQDVTEPMQAYMRERGTRPLGDLVIHEQDLRGALGVSGAQDTCGLAVIRDRMLAPVRPEGRRAAADRADGRWLALDIGRRRPRGRAGAGLRAGPRPHGAWLRPPDPGVDGVRRRGALPARVRDPGALPDRDLRE